MQGGVGGGGEAGPAGLLQQAALAVCPAPQRVLHAQREAALRALAGLDHAAALGLAALSIVVITCVFVLVFLPFSFLLFSFIFLSITFFVLLQKNSHVEAFMNN